MKLLARFCSWLQPLQWRINGLSLSRICGVQYFARRFCGSTGRRWAFDQMHKSGRWLFDDGNRELIAAIEKYASMGNILILGCGTASVVSHLNQDTFEYLLGVDLSPVAIAKARDRCENHKIHFQVRDMLEYHCQRKYDVILLSESLYYMTAIQGKSLLKKLSRNLTVGGRIIVTIYNPKRYMNIIEMIREAFVLTKEETMEGTDRYLMIFR